MDFNTILSTQNKENNFYRDFAQTKFFMTSNEIMAR